MQNATKGFTLIELLVVIAIIGILASVVLSSLSSARISARDSARLQEARHLQTALELYRTRHGYYPCANGTVDAVSGCAADVQITPDNSATNAAFRNAIGWTYRADGGRLRYRLGSSDGTNNNPIQDTYTIRVQLEGGRINSAGQNIVVNAWCKISQGPGHPTYVSFFNCF